MSRIFNVLKSALVSFYKDDAFILAAAISFYTILSLAPLVVLMVSAASLVSDSAQEVLVNEVRTLLGPSVSGTLQTIINNAEFRTSADSITAIAGLIILPIAATTAFVQVQYCLNRVWNIRVDKVGQIWGWVRKRLFSLLLVAIIGLVLSGSLAVSFVLNMVVADWEWVHSLASILVFTILFALIFKLIPDADISWNVVWFGAVFTATLFVLGRFGIGKYLSYSSRGSAYGAAGSLVVLLIWIYYASLIFLLGAEVTQAYADESGRKILPSSYAAWLNPRLSHPGEGENET